MRTLDRDYEAFKILIKDEKMINIDTGNGVFTWSNKRGGDHQMASRLDHFLASKEFLLQLMDIKESILPIGGSNFWSVVLVVEMIGTPKN